MQEVKGDIWKLAHFLRDVIVIPTNIGWRKDGTNVMGRGLAAQAVKRFPDLPALYGEHCIQYGAETPLFQCRVTGPTGGRHLLLAPTKPLKIAAPHMSWQQKSSLATIEQSLVQLSRVSPAHPGGRILVPLLGCGNGGLRREPVRELMDKYLLEDHFIRVRWRH
jgi:hypothetical protein